MNIQEDYNKAVLFHSTCEKRISELEHALKQVVGVADYYAAILKHEHFGFCPQCAPFESALKSARVVLS